MHYDNKDVQELNKHTFSCSCLAITINDIFYTVVTGIVNSSKNHNKAKQNK